MKILQKGFVLNGKGFVELVAEDTEDLWHLYNIIYEGDEIKSKTTRKVNMDTAGGSSKGASTFKKRLDLTISVKSVFYDPNGGQFRVKGISIEQNEFIRLGQFHTIDLELNQKIKIGKENWDSIFVKRLEDAADVSKKADVAAVICTDGLAHVCLLTQSTAITKQKIETTIPKKKQIGKGHENAKTNFYNQVLNSMIANINFDVVKAVIIASPAFVKDELYTFIKETVTSKASTEPKMKNVFNHLGIFMLIHISSGHKQALKEVLADPAVAAKLQDTKASEETNAMKEFFRLLRKEPNKAFYGKAHVKEATSQGAVSILMMTDNLFRSCNLTERKQYVQMADDVRNSGGKVLVYSSLHVSGEELSRYSGIAAILKYPIEIDDMEEADEEDAQEDEDEEEEEESESQEDEEEEEESDSESENEEEPEEEVEKKPKQETKTLSMKDWSKKSGFEVELEKPKEKEDIPSTFEKQKPRTPLFEVSKPKTPNFEVPKPKTPNFEVPKPKFAPINTSPATLSTAFERKETTSPLIIKKNPISFGIPTAKPKNDSDLEPISTLNLKKEDNLSDGSASPQPKTPTKDKSKAKRGKKINFLTDEDQLFEFDV